MNEQETSRLLSLYRGAKAHRNRYAHIQSRRTAKKGRIQILKNSRVVSEVGLEGQQNHPHWTKYQH